MLTDFTALYNQSVQPSSRAVSVRLVDVAEMTAEAGAAIRRRYFWLGRMDSNHD